MALKAYKYERRGLLAIDPRAFFDVFVLDDAPRENAEVGDAVIVDVRGPLEQHAHYWCDSYEAIVQRVALACETSARAVILRFDSPGGEVAGMLEAGTAIGEMCAARNKQLHALVEGHCSSAAYALASRAQSITATPTSLVGSIGVLSCREDCTALNTARGLRVEFIASGVHKTAGHPDSPITDAELAEAQTIVDSMAAMFFELVAETRSTSVESVAGLEARVFHAPAAIDAGLVDEIGTLQTVLARVASFSTGDTQMPGTGKPKAAASPYQKARELLQEAAEGDDANAEAAKRALAALGEEKPAEEKPAEEKPEEVAEGDEKKPGAEGDEEKPAAEGDEEKPGATGDDDKLAAVTRIALAAERRSKQLEAKLAKKDEDEERANLIASRPDLSDNERKILAKAPMKLVRETIAGMDPIDPAAVKTAASTTPKRVTITPSSSAKAQTPGATRNAGNTSPSSGEMPASLQSPEAAAAMDRAMGLSAAVPPVRNTEFALRLSAHQPIARPGAAPNPEAAPANK